MSNEVKLDPVQLLPKVPFYRLKFKPNPIKAIKFSKYQPHRGKKQKERYNRVKQMDGDWQVR